MGQIKATLLHSTPLNIGSHAIRMCKDSFRHSDDGGRKDMQLLDRVGNKMKHESVKNHINYTFEVRNISTKTLLALTRHDVGVEFSVQSTRFTCKKGEYSITETENQYVNNLLHHYMEAIEELREKGIGCDDLSMLLPAAYQYNLVVTFSLTALQHFLDLRDKRDAHWDIQNLAKVLRDTIPKEDLFMFD